MTLTESLCFGNNSEEFAVYSRFSNRVLILLGLFLRQELTGKQTSPPQFGMPFKHADPDSLPEEKVPQMVALQRYLSMFIL